MKNRKTQYCKMAREAVLQGDRYFGQRDYRGASVFYLKASQLGSKEGNKKYRQVQELLGDSDLVNPAQYAKNQKKNYATMESPKKKASLSIPSDGARILIPDHCRLQQVPREQKEKKNKTAEKSENENAHIDNADELLGKALELETKGKKKDALQLFRQAADNGSEIAKAKIGQLYLERALKYLGQRSILERLEEKIPFLSKVDNAKVSSAHKSSFRYQRNRIADLNGFGDMAETETSDLHAAQAGETIWVGAAQKNNPSTPEVIIQEVVRYVTYWWGDDCLPELIRVDCPEPEVWEFTRKNGQEFSAESIVWTKDFTEVLPREEESPQNEAEDASDKLPREDVGEPSWGDIFALIFRKLFSFFANDGKG